MAFSPRAGRAVISLGVDGAASSKKDIDGVADSLKKVNDSSFQKLSGQVSAIQSHIGGLKGTLTDLAQLTVAGISAGAFVGMIKGSLDAADNLNDLSKTTGVTVANLAGLKLAAQQSGGDLAGIADSINKLSMAMGRDAEKFSRLGITAKEPLEAFKQLSAVFSAIDDPQTRAALGAATLGESWVSAAPLLAEGGARISEMVSTGTALAGTTQEMADRADEFNDKMAEMSTAIDGAKMKLANEMAPAMTQVTTAIIAAYEESGKFQAVWVGMGALGSFLFTDEFSSAKVKIENLRVELAQLEQDLSLSKNSPAFGFVGRALWGESTESLEADVARVKGQIEALKKTMEPPTEEFVDAFGDKFMAAVEAYRVRSALEDGADQKKREAAAKAAAAAALRQREAYTALTTSIKGRVAETERELAGLEPLNEAERLRIDLAERLVTGKLKLSPVQKAEYEQHIKNLDANLALIEAQLMSNRVREATAKMLKGQHDAAEKTIADAIEEAERNEELANTFGLTAGAVAQLEVARLEEQLAQRSSLGLTSDEIEQLEQLIGVKKRNADAVGTREGLEASKRANDEMISDSKRMADSIEHNLSDALMRGFESGKGFLENLRDTAKNMFKTLILQPTISGIMAPLSGALAGAFMPSMAGAATTATASGVGSAIGTGLGIGGAFGAIGTGAMQTAGAILTGQIGLGSTLSAGLSAIGTGSASGIMAGLSSVVGALGPIALGIGAAVAIWKKLDTSGTMHTGGASRATAEGVKTISAESLNFQGTVASKATNELTAGLASGIVKILDSTAASFGKTAGYTAATAFADDTSKDGAWGALLIEKMGQQVVNWQDTRTSRWAPKEFADGQAGQAQYLSALSGSVRTALEGIGLPAWATSMLDALGEGPTIEQLASVVDNINATQSALKAMGDTLVGFADLSDSAVSALIKASGGIGALSAAASSYRDNFYSEQEKSASAFKQMTEALSAVGLALPATREEFRAMVETNTALGEAGAPAVAALLGLNQTFAALVPAATAAVNAVDAQTAATVESAAAMRAAASGLLGGVDDAFSVLQRVAQGSIDTLTARIAKGRALSDTIRSTIDSMTMQGNEMTDRARAQAQVRGALSSAKSGALPDADRLSKALSVLSQDASSMFSSYEEYARDFYTTQNDIAALGSVADSALSVDEKALSALEEMLRSTQAEIDVLKGIDTNGLTLIQAVEGVRAAILAAQQNELVSSAASINGAYKSALGRAPEAVGMEYWQDKVANGAPISTVVDAIKNSPEAKVQGLYQSLLGRTGDAAGIDYWTKAMSAGISEQDVRASIMRSAEYLNPKAIPGFAAGGDHSGGARIVGENGPELEITGPSRIFNATQTESILRGGSTAALEAAITRLTAVVQQQQAIIDKIERNTKRQADQFDYVTEGGEAMRTLPA